MASLTQWTCVCATSGGFVKKKRKLGVLWFMGSGVGHDSATEQQQFILLT